MRIGRLAACAAMLGWVLVPPARADFMQGFEVDRAGWFDNGGTVQRVSSGTGGIASSEGSFHALVGAGVFTRWGGYSSVFPTYGYTTAVDIYLDIDGGHPDDHRFDWSSAINNPSGSHRRDFILTGGYYNDVGPYGSGAGFVFSASNTAPGWPKNPGRNPFAVTAEGWYTMQHRFYDSGAGVLACELSLLNAGGTSLHSWVLSDPTDLIGTTVGGNRYGWLVTSEFASLAIDDSKLIVGAQAQVVPEPGSLALLGGGLLVLARRRRR